MRKVLLLLLLTACAAEEDAALSSFGTASPGGVDVGAPSPDDASVGDVGGHVDQDVSSPGDATDVAPDISQDTALPPACEVDGDCDDGLPCTQDQCTAMGHCAAPVAPGYCLIQGACHDKGDSNPANACLGCRPGVKNDGWSPADGFACDDGDPCTQGDHCQGGACLSGAPDPCDDGNPCTTDHCAPGSGCVHAPSALACTDGDACTLGDVCVDGACVSGAALSCDDGNPCTEDTCDPATGCVHVATDADCDDANGCTTDDHCDGGQCVGSGPLDCDDGNPCTLDDCLEDGSCLHEAQDGAPCSDGDPCTMGDRCSGDVCVPGPAKSCDDSNPCTTASCDAQGTCVHEPQDASCDDGDACTVGEVCLAGECAGLSLDCDDGDPCTDDGCDPATGCTHAENAAPCDDGDACTTGDACAGGVCGGAPLDCDDDDPCTDDTCHPLLGCRHAPGTAPCDDGDACTTDDACAGGVCGGTPTDCDDGDPCTEDTCDPVLGCQHAPGIGPCDDGDLCTEDGCDPVSGCSHVATTCDDGDPCTGDGCDPATGCSHLAVERMTPSCPASWLPPDLVAIGLCDPAVAPCSFEIEAGSELLEDLQRIYRGASVFYATTFADAAGRPQPNRFPAAQGVTPVEGTCCAEMLDGSGLPFMDTNDNGLCDGDPARWTTAPWSQVGFGLGDPFCEGAEVCAATGEQAWLYAFDGNGLTGPDASLTLRATTHAPACQGSTCVQTLALEVAKDPAAVFEATILSPHDGEPVTHCVAGCHLVAPEAVSYSLTTSCAPDPVETIEGQIVLTTAQRAGFVTGDDLPAAYPKLQEGLDRLEQMAQGAAAALAASAPGACRFPVDQGPTPVEASCCAWSGSPIDVDADQRCDANPAPWQTETWEALGFAIEDQHHFIYAFHASGLNEQAEATASAYADLDCDGTYSTFQRMIFAPPGDYAGTCAPGGAQAEIVPYLYAENPTE